MGVKAPQSNSSFSLPAIQPGTTQVVATGGVSAQSAAAGGSCIRLCCTQDCWVKIGSNPTADKTASMFLPAGAVEYFMCQSTDLVAVLQDSAAGSLSITPAQEL